MIPKLGLLQLLRFKEKLKSEDTRCMRTDEKNDLLVNNSIPGQKKTKTALLTFNQSPYRASPRQKNDCFSCEHLRRLKKIWKTLGGGEALKRSQTGQRPKKWTFTDLILLAAARVLNFRTTCLTYSQIRSAAAPVVRQVLWALVYVMTAKQHTYTVRLTELLHGQRCGKPKQNHYKHFHLLNWHAAECKSLFHGSVQRSQEQRQDLKARNMPWY